MGERADQAGIRESTDDNGRSLIRTGLWGTCKNLVEGAAAGGGAAPCWLVESTLAVLGSSLSARLPREPYPFLLLPALADSDSGGLCAQYRLCSLSKVGQALSCD